MASAPLVPQNEVTETVPVDASQHGEDHENEKVEEVVVGKRKRQKTSSVWNDFDEVELPGGVKKAVCKYCKEKFATGGRGASTSHLRRHAETCVQRQLHLRAEKKQPTIPFRPSNAGNPFIYPGVRYSNGKMAADILAIPISTVASESTFSAGGRVIDEHRSKLNGESVEALICGGDWLRHKYGLQKKSKVAEQQEEIILKI